MKTIIHINQHNIRSNITSKEILPVITCKTYKSNDYYNNIDLVHKESGLVIGKVIYSPDKPLSCGARVWIEIDSNIIEIKGE
jgi:hypothetical protein